MVKSGSEYDGGAASNEQIQVLQAEIVTLKKAFAEMAQANSIENVIGHGMKNLVAMLEPLRALRPSRTALEAKEAGALAAIHATLERPDYSNLETGVLEGFDRPNKGKSEGKRS